MDFEAWLAAPHPPIELLEAIARGDQQVLEGLTPFSRSGEEGARWAGFLIFKCSFGRYCEIITKLIEYYEARDQTEYAHIGVVADAAMVEGVNYTLGLVNNARARSDFDYYSRLDDVLGAMDPEFYNPIMGHVFKDPYSHIQAFDAAVDAVKKTLGEYENHERKGRERLDTCIQRQGELEEQIRKMFDL